MNSVISQIRLAVAPGNRLAALLGALVGGLPPVASYGLVHHALASNKPLWTQPLAYLVGGLMLFSALSVVRWTEAAFRTKTRALGWAKAIGWTLGVEGLLLLAPAGLEWLGAVCVAYLVGINAISAACGFVADYAAERDRSKASRRAAAAAPSKVRALRPVGKAG